MSNVQVQTTITGDLFNAQLFLNGREIDLSDDGGTTWQSTNMIEPIDDIVDILVRAQGIPSTKWALDFVELQPDSKELFKKDFEIGPNGVSIVPKAVKV
jgi:hypothetical protein